MRFALVIVKTLLHLGTATRFALGKKDNHKMGVDTKIQNKTIPEAYR